MRIRLRWQHVPRHSLQRRWWIVALLFVAVLVNYIDRNNLSVANVPVMNDFEFSPTAAGILMSAFYWSYTIFQIPSGWAVDRFGIRGTYGVAFLVWSVSAAAIGLARSFSQILVMRMILGLGQAAAQPVSLGYIRRNFEESEQGMPTGLYISGMMIGPALGGLLGAALLDTYGWRLMFLLTGLIPCLWLIPWFWLAPAGKMRPANSNHVTNQTISFSKLFANPVVWGISIAAFFYSYFWYFCMTWLPSYLVMERRLSFLEMGIYTALPYIAMAVVAPSAGRLADRWIARTHRVVLVRKIFIISGFTLGSTTILLNWVSASGLAVAILVFGLAGIGLASANYWALTQAITPKRLIGRAVGYQNTINNLAGIFSPIITGFLVDRSGSFGSAIVFASAALWVAAISYGCLVSESRANEIRNLY